MRTPLGVRCHILVMVTICGAGEYSSRSHSVSMHCVLPLHMALTTDSVMPSESIESEVCGAELGEH